jgi:hypothetical protein
MLSLSSTSLPLHLVNFNQHCIPSAAYVRLWSGNVWCVVCAGVMENEVNTQPHTHTYTLTPYTLTPYTLTPTHSHYTLIFCFYIYFYFLYLLFIYFFIFILFYFYYVIKIKLATRFLKLFSLNFCTKYKANAKLLWIGIWSHGYKIFLSFYKNFTDLENWKFWLIQSLDK